MAQLYSAGLIKQFKAVYEKRAKRTISDDEADIYLDRLAELGLIAYRVLLDEEKTDKAKKNPPA